MQDAKLKLEFPLVASKYQINSLTERYNNVSIYSAMCRETNAIVTIKHISKCFINPKECRSFIREIQILRHFSEIKNNSLLPKLIDIILPIRDDCYDG